MVVALLNIRQKRTTFIQPAISYVLLDVSKLTMTVALRKRAVRHEEEILSCLFGIVYFVDAVYVVA